jgi:hypothetical protein
MCRTDAAAVTTNRSAGAIPVTVVALMVNVHTGRDRAVSQFVGKAVGLARASVFAPADHELTVVAAFGVDGSGPGPAGIRIGILERLGPEPLSEIGRLSRCLPVAGASTEATVATRPVEERAATADADRLHWHRGHTPVVKWPRSVVSGRGRTHCMQFTDQPLDQNIARME